jgi:hypothetical protein
MVMVVVVVVVVVIAQPDGACDQHLRPFLHSSIYI